MLIRPSLRRRTLVTFAAVAAVLLGLVGVAVAKTVAQSAAGSSTVSGAVTDGSGHGWPIYAKITLDQPAEQFTDWTGTTAQDGWSLTDNSGSANMWRFDDPKFRGNQTGGTGSFAIADAFLAPSAATDTSLVSPTFDLRADTNPHITFDSATRLNTASSTASVDLSIDGGQTWTAVWNRGQGPDSFNESVDIPIPQAAGQQNVQVRFDYTAGGLGFWELDNFALVMDSVTTYTNPFTGAFHLDLPQNADYTLHVAPVLYPGYEAKDVGVHVAGSDVQQDVSLVVDPDRCSAPGYTSPADVEGVSTDFEGWTGKTPRDGWAAADNNGGGDLWRFDDPRARGNLTGSTGGFADAESIADHTDTYLTSPLVDLSAVTNPHITFASAAMLATPASTAEVDLSTDGGQTWASVWHVGQGEDGTAESVDISIPQAAGQSKVQARFRFTTDRVPSAALGFWQVDHVLIGSKTCPQVPGGLVAGTVTDANTGSRIDGATVNSHADPSESGTSTATPGDPNLNGGFYSLFTSQNGNQQFDASDGRYAAATATVNVAPDSVTRQDWALQAGHLHVSTQNVSVTEALGSRSNAKLTFTNDGTAPVHVALTEHNAAPIPQDGRPAAAKPSKWTEIPDFPDPNWGNVVGDDNGKVYSAGGTSGANDDYKYDPATQKWSPFASIPAHREYASGAFVDGTLYVVGGQDAHVNVMADTFAYDPGSDSWTRVADIPQALTYAASAVLDGELYIIGGFHCLRMCDSQPISNAVYRYDPLTNTWGQLADYPTPIGQAGCAGINDEIVCAGGLTDFPDMTKSTYIYHPATNTWTQAADMPYPDSAMAQSGANDKLQLATGNEGAASDTTDRAVEYDPISNSWTDLPSVNHAKQFAGSTCGMYVIGGEGGAASVNTGTQRNPWAEVLPGYDHCGGGVDVPWLTESETGFDVAPGKSVILTVTMNSAAVHQPGDYAATLAIATDSPYFFDPITVGMHVTPPPSWGRVTGTVTAAGGGPIAGATVEICAGFNKGDGSCGSTHYTLQTDAHGSYQLWLDQSAGPVQVIAAKDSFQQQVSAATISGGATSTANFSLRAI